MANEKIVKFWRGTRQAYTKLAQDKKLDYWTRYSVIEPDGRRNEYFGSKPVTPATGQLYPVIDIVRTLPNTLNVGDRYLVGVDSSNGQDGEYYVVEICADMSQSIIRPLGDFSVRVKNEGLKEYMFINGKLTTYDGRIDCGTF